MTHALDAALETLARDPAAPLDLAQIALLLARDEFPNLDVEAHINELNAMAHEVQPYLRGHLAHQVQGLCRYLFHEMGYRGNTRDYYDPRNSYLNVVMERRLGIPITLAAITMAVGQRAGLTIAGVGLPGHFIVKAIDPRQEILIDPFHGGRVLSTSDCENLIQQATGGKIDVSALALDVAPVGTIVVRMLNNLRAIYFKKQDWTRSIRVLDRLRQLQPQDAGLKRDLGICYVRVGQPGRAIDLLRRYVDDAQDADDVENVKTILDGAVKAVAEWN